MKNLFTLSLFFFLVACGRPPKKTEIPDGKYFFFQGNCGTESTWGHTILVTNGEPDIITFVAVEKNADLDVIYINGTNCQDIYVWEGRY